MDPVVQVALITSVTGLFAGVMEGYRRQHKAIAEVKETSRATRDQVVNGHPTNLRSDLDDLRDQIGNLLDCQIVIGNKLEQGMQGLQASQARHEAALTEQSIDINGLRGELRHERDERLDVARRLDTHLRRDHD